MRSLLCLSVLSLVPTLAYSQVPVLSAGDELKRLEPLVGTWRGRIERRLPNGNQLVVEPIVTYDWVTGGVWLRGDDLTELPDGTIIENRTELTWHHGDEIYTGIWLDNVFPAPIAFTGTWQDTETLELDTGEFLLGERKHQALLTYHLDSENLHRTVMRQAWDGKEPAVVAEGRFERLHSSIRQLPNPMEVFEPLVGDWVTEEWEADASGHKKRTAMETRWALDGKVLHTEQYAEYDDGSRTLELEERVSWDPIRGQFETLIQSTQGWVAYARYLVLDGGLRRLDCDVVFDDGRVLGVIDLFQNVTENRIRWESYFILNGKKGLEPEAVYTLVRRKPATG